MEANTLLAIVIPTFNRAQYLDRCLAIHIPLARAHNIEIIISDNASSDETEQLVAAHMSEYAHLRYYRNDENVGADRNFERALKYPQADYVWLLGDTYQIAPDAIAGMLDLLGAGAGGYDAVIVNVDGRVADIATQDYVDQNRLLADLGWHMTCMASLVYHSRTIRGGEFARYQRTNFIQTGVLFEYIVNQAFRVHWSAATAVRPLVLKHVKKQGWQDKTFEIWTESWANFVFSLPASYALSNKLKCIADHGIKSGIFSIRSLLKLRGDNILGPAKFASHGRYFALTIASPKPLIFLIAVLPRFIVNGLVSMRKLMKAET